VTLRFLSLFSGIEAASAAWLPLGWQCVGVAEIEPFACAVLSRRYPDVPNLGDVLAPDFLQRAAALRPDVLVGGPPCQDFSIAGLRAGLDGERGNLSLRWVEVVRAIRPLYAVTENVPGWLSVNRGHAFGAFLAGLVGHDTALVPPKSCGGRWTDAGMVDGPDGRVAWRVLDAQFFGLAQRRRRVFAVHCPRGGADPAAVLFERARLQGHSPPRREAGEGVALCLANGTGSVGGQRYDGESEDFVVSTLTGNGDAHSGFRDDAGLIAHSLRADGFDASEDGTGRGTPLVPALYQDSQYGVGEYDSAGALRAGRIPEHQMVVKHAAVRRLTPRECERLQGFEDDYTAIPYRGHLAADGNRYRALGNSMAVPVVSWLGERIQKEHGRILSAERTAA